MTRRIRRTICRRRATLINKTVTGAKNLANGGLQNRSGVTRLRHLVNKGIVIGNQVTLGQRRVNNTVSATPFIIRLIRLILISVQGKGLSFALGTLNNGRGLTSILRLLHVRRHVRLNVITSRCARQSSFQSHKHYSHASSWISCTSAVHPAGT